MTTTVSEKGQVTIPKALRDSLGLRAGTRLNFGEREGTLIARKQLDRDPIAALRGILPPLDVDAAIREMRGPGWEAVLDPPLLPRPKKK